MSNSAPHGTRHSESNVEQRVQIALAVRSEKLQALLPAKLRSTIVPAGPSEGANFFIAFRNRLQGTYHDADGTDRIGDRDLGAVVLAMVKDAETPESGFWVLRSLAASPSAVPGPYRNSKKVKASMEKRTETHDYRSGVGVESWYLEDDDGNELSLYLRFDTGIPTRTIGESKVRGGPDPEFFRIYRTDRGIDVVRSVPGALDRVQQFEFRCKLSEFDGLFDGSEQVVSISVEPWYVREVFIRDTV